MTFDPYCDLDPGCWNSHKAEKNINKARRLSTPKTRAEMCDGRIRWVLMMSDERRQNITICLFRYFLEACAFL